ncbi:TauD-domain-containing protein [Coprinopsis marcescibilis]|uniref:TauD-domain-containing protein n=1 Tax=Coprinopsis marcescibilis TaxID=230819 RepID=A0A5C3KWI9_COPMA|nr:TauD-domain-containing protein [Coprinopsis marcescibilis]
MAPSVSEVKTDKVVADVASLKQANQAIEGKVNNGPAYPFYYPHHDTSEKILRCGSPRTKPNLLSANTSVSHMSPYIGTELRGVQISELTKDGLNELVLYVAERKVIVFRDQDFKDLTPERQIEFVAYFGPNQKHPMSGNAKGFPEFHVVYKDAAYNRLGRYRGLDTRANLVSWHSDVAYEKQPPGTTFFILEQPDVGGDTLFASQVEAYNRLSNEFKKRLEGLTAINSAVPQAEFSRNSGGPVRREPVETEHPVVRVHPFTARRRCTSTRGSRRRLWFKQEESDFLLKFLFYHVAKGSDFQIRARYEPGSVIVWDNRVTVHSATPDYDPSNWRRHAVRLTPGRGTGCCYVCLNGSPSIPYIVAHLDDHLVRGQLFIWYSLYGSTHAVADKTTHAGTGVRGSYAAGGGGTVRGMGGSAAARSSGRRVQSRGSVRRTGASSTSSVSKFGSGRTGSTSGGYGYVLGVKRSGSGGKAYARSRRGY